MTRLLLNFKMRTLYLIFQSMRPRQWIKNAVVLAPLIFSGKASNVSMILKALYATVLFCLVSSATYIINDLLDREKDKNHPEKCRRPIIKGDLRPRPAITTSLLLAFSAIVISFLLNANFGWIVFSYFCLGTVYSLFLKRIVIVDVMSISILFVFRVAGGAAAIEAHTSNWLFLCTVLLALFLGFGKRRHELVLLDNQAGEHREILREYSPYFLDQMMSVVTASTVIAYSLYAISPDVAEKLGTPYLYLTIPFVLYGIFRYLYLIHQKEEGGSPSAILFNDKPLLVNILLWAVTVIFILYSGGR